FLDFWGAAEESVAVPNRLPDELGAALGLLDDLDQVFADECDGEQIEAAEKRNQHDDGRDTVRKRGVPHDVDALIDDGQEGERRQHGPDVAEQLDGGEAERKDALLGPPQVRKEAMRRTPEASLGANVVDAHLLEADPSPKPAQELIGFGQSEQFAH